MWSIRFLNGKQAGQIVPLKNGATVIGRAPDCDLVIPSQGVSKQHLKIEILADKVIVTDLNSRNGTFVNGIQIKTQRVHAGDKISINDIIFELTDRTIKMKPKSQRLPRAQGRGPAASMQGNLAPQLWALDPLGMPEAAPMPQAGAAVPSPEASATPGVSSFAKQYFENVVMPGVYKLAEWMEFRWVIGTFVVAFIVTVTALSIVPLMRILADSVESESRNNAANLAKYLAELNTAALKGGYTSSLSIERVRRPGVEKAYILDSTGVIIAPPEFSGKYPSETFVNDARKRVASAVEVIENKKVAAVEPIKVFNEKIGDTSALGYAVIIYNMGTLEVSESRTLSLLIQVGFLALILGGILYIFFVKLIEHPINVMNQQVKDALRDGKTEVAVTYQFPQLQELATNINSAVQRALSGDIGALAGQQFEADRTAEMQGIVNCVGFPAAAVHPRERSFTAANSHFQDQITRGQDWVYTKLDSILEQSLRLNLLNLCDVVEQNPQHYGQDELEINNVIYSITAQGVMGAKELAYILFVFTPKVGG